ncbi:hypothetical protein GGR51DRAFT_192817 [Nemania sp. FL0031]|nr:hypothetical protein GGR51DRAFT_192817 [Nemania sp. FL0031]
MDAPRPATRSACDRCRAKRVRCPRGENSATPCARCIHAGAQCVTGSPGYPGRPRKTRLVGGTIPGAPVMTPASVSSPGRESTPRDPDYVEVRTPAVGEPVSTGMPVERAVTPSLNTPNDLGGTRLGLSKPSIRAPNDSLFQESSDFYLPPNGTNLFDFPFTEESPASGSIPALVEQLSNPSQGPQLLSAADNLDMMLTGQSSNNMLDVDPFFDPFEWPSDAGPLKCPSAARSLMRFQEKMEQRVSAMGAYFLEPRNVVEGCKADGLMNMGTENPVATILLCTKEFIDIVQNLTATQPTTSDSLAQNQLPPPSNAPRATRTESLSTEIALLVLSSYLMLMRLYDSLFHGVYHSLCEQPSETIKSLKAKAVFRIGGISSLQDLPIKAYAMGIVDVIQSQIQTLERCLGIPAEYCLSGEMGTSQATRGLFANGDRAHLFYTVMSQADVRSQRDNKSYVESIRENIQQSVAFFND